MSHFLFLYKFSIFFSMKTTVTSIPNWNLDTLYKGLEAPEYKKALSDYTASMDEIDTLLDTADKFTREANNNFDFAAWLATFLEADNKCTALESTLSGYAYIIYSTDTTNTSYLNNISKIEEMGLRSQQQGIKFSTLLTAHQKYLPEIGRASCRKECRSRWS